MLEESCHHPSHRSGSAPVLPLTTSIALLIGFTAEGIARGRSETYCAH